MEQIWTPEAVEFLKKNYSNMTNDELGKRLRVFLKEIHSNSSINYKAGALKLKKSKSFKQQQGRENQKLSVKYRKLADYIRKEENY